MDNSKDKAEQTKKLPAMHLISGAEKGPMSNGALTVENCAIPYASPLFLERCTCSIDNINLKFEFRNSMYNWVAKEFQTTGERLFKYFAAEQNDWLDVSPSPQGENTGQPGKYHDVIHIRISTGASFAVKLGRYDNRGKPLPEMVVDYNPNKVAPEVIDWLIAPLLPDCIAVTIMRYDVAFDFPIARDCLSLVHLDKKRNWQDMYKDGHLTQYLGVHNRHGFIKLYDKQAECHLPGPMTRLEITIDNRQFHKKSIAKLWPDIINNYDTQIPIKHNNMRLDSYTCVLHPDLLEVYRTYLHRGTFRKLKADYVKYSPNSLLRLSDEEMKAADQYIAHRLTELTYLPGRHYPTAEDAEKIVLPEWGSSKVTKKIS